MGNWFGPTYEDVNYIGLGGEMGRIQDTPLTDDKLEQLVEASITSWDQQRGFTTYGEQLFPKWDDSNNPANTTNPTEKQDVFQWFALIANPGRSEYSSKKDWLNAIRDWLNRHGETEAYYSHHPNQSSGIKNRSFDILQWRTLDDPQWRSDSLYDPAAGWDNLDKELAGYYLGGINNYDKTNLQTHDFPYLQDWANQTANTDIKWTGTPPNDWQGLGVTQFLEWLTGLDYVELFSYEYSLILIITLFAIAYTDLYPFFYG